MSYTFTNGECPITYITKLYINPMYVAGDTIHYFPEMVYYFNLTNTIRYFRYTTIIYLCVLYHLAKRQHILHKLYTLSIVLSIYFLFVYKILHFSFFNYNKKIEQLIIHKI